MNILITSAGRRVNLIKFFKEALQNLNLDGEVYAINNDPNSASLYEADKARTVPKVTADNYLDILLELCEENEIDIVLSLIDPELPELAENREKFTERGIEVIVSDSEAIETCFDKYKMAKYFAEINVPHAKTSLHKKNVFEKLKTGKISYPLMVKPIRGSASKGLYKINNREELDSSPVDEEDFLVQEFIKGDEHGVDAFVDERGELKSVFLKRKISMRAGETDKAVSLIDEDLFKQVEKIVSELNFYGPIDIDCFRNENGDYIFSEINPRFGGGYPLAHKAGMNFMEKIIRMVNGEKLKKDIGDYEEGIFMFKYNGLQIVDESEIIE